eukprot:754044-Hanusia_phi.AAC.2
MLALPPDVLLPDRPRPRPTVTTRSTSRTWSSLQETESSGLSLVSGILDSFAAAQELRIFSAGQLSGETGCSPPDRRHSTAAVERASCSMSRSRFGCRLAGGWRKVEESAEKDKKPVGR